MAEAEAGVSTGAVAAMAVAVGATGGRIGSGPRSAVTESVTVDIVMASATAVSVPMTVAAVSAVVFTTVLGIEARLGALLSLVRPLSTSATLEIMTPSTFSAVKIVTVVMSSLAVSAVASASD
jgi:hypothetical protein